MKAPGKICRRLYAATFRYGAPNLVLVSVLKETPKRYHLEKVATLTGSIYFGDWTRKDKAQFFPDLVSAARWLWAKAQARREDILADLKETEQWIETLQEVCEKGAWTDDREV